MASTILFEKDQVGIAVITLNRSDAANALSLEMLNELKDLLEEIRYDREVRCLIITGSGEKVFCAGADLKERSGMNEMTVRKTVGLIRATISAVEDLPMPVIAALNGAALGGGMELALACDLRVAADHAKMGLTETSLGIIPGAGGTQRLPRLIGKGKAKELIYTAKRVETTEALKIGLIEYAVSQTELLDKARELANQIVKNAPIAIKQAKLAIDKGLEVDLQTGLALEQAAYEITIPTEDRLEGLKAFKEKRKPNYIGK